MTAACETLQVLLVSGGMFLRAPLEHDDRHEQWCLSSSGAYLLGVVRVKRMPTSIQLLYLDQHDRLLHNFCCTLHTYH